MNALVSASVRAALTPDGHMWCKVGALPYRACARYLEAYDEVRLLVRAVPMSEPPTGWVRMTGPGVMGVPVPDFHSPVDLARRYPEIRARVRGALGETQAVHLRLGCPLGDVVWRNARHRPYGVEVVTDPYDGFAPGSVEHPLRPLFRWWFPRQLKAQCQAACAASYVTAHALQRRYAAAPDALSVGVSDVELDDHAFVSAPRSNDRWQLAVGSGQWAVGKEEGADPRSQLPTANCQLPTAISNQQSSLTLITIGSLERLYKAPDVLIDAVGVCIDRGLDLRLVLVGDGRYRESLAVRAAKAGLAQRVHFAGQVPSGAPVRAQLDQADLFVLPSYTEGLPRAMVEAMARALPCIGSTVGGVPELLPAEDMVTPGDTLMLAAKITEVYTQRGRLARMSERNLARAKHYHEETLRPRRAAFYQYVKQQTELWLRLGARS